MGHKRKSDKQKFIKNMLESDTATEASLKTWPNLKNRNVASNKAVRYLTDATICNELQAAAEAEGLDFSYIVKRLKKTIGQSDNLNASNSALNIYLGFIKPQRTENINKNVNLNLKGSINDLYKVFSKALKDDE